MRITNLHGLPEPLVKAVSSTTYSKGDAEFSISELCKPSRIVALERKYADQLEEDASDRIWALIGTIGHEILRRGTEAYGDIVERRFFMEINGTQISGQCDYGKDGIIYDYKFCSIWTVKDGIKPEWEQQLNGYKLLVEESDEYGDAEVKGLCIVTIFRDWSVSEAKRNRDYPQSQVMSFNVPMWNWEDTWAWLAERIASHKAAIEGDLPECTSEEMWERPMVFAVHKKGQKRAVKLYDTEAMANAHVASDPGRLEVQLRPGSRPRCENYCIVAPWCEQFQNWRSQQGAEVNQQQTQTDLL